MKSFRKYIYCEHQPSSRFLHQFLPNTLKTRRHNTFAMQDVVITNSFANSLLSISTFESVILHESQNQK